MRKLMACVVALAATAAAAPAATIRFDDARAVLGNGGNPATFYTVSQGVTFSGTYFGLVGGNGNGDPGNWNLEGTNGSAFLGTNQGIGTGPNILFSAPQGNVTLDVGQPGFNWTNSFTATSYLNGVVVQALVFNLSSPTDPGNWHTVSFTSPLDRIEIRLGAGNGFGFGVDNINFQAAATPEPVSLLVFGGLVAGGGWLVRRRMKAAVA